MEIDEVEVVLLSDLLSVLLSDLLAVPVVVASLAEAVSLEVSEAEV